MPKTKVLICFSFGTPGISVEDNLSSEVTHNLSNSKNTSSEIFLTTLVPLVRKTPSKTLSDYVPIFVDGT